MSQPNVLEERECVERCRCTEHGELVCATLTKREALDTELCAYLHHICCSCGSVKDALGRNALHVAASCGRLDVVKWLLRMKHANINAKDSESGYTPLHRSIFYGKINIAVHLIKLGANITLTDFNGLTSLEHAMEDCWRSPSPYDSNQGEVYVWGSNTNYTLGPQQARLMPELLDAYHKEYPNLYVQQVCLEKFHCMLVSRDGKIFACGHGQGGRLGLSTEKTVIAPKPLKLSASGHANPIICKKASIAIDHSVFLTESGHVWTCGLNTHRVLGVQPPPAQVLTPCPLSLTQHPVEDVCAARYHTVAWGPTAIYTWGLHGGQLGHDKSNHKYIISPKLVTCLFGLDCKIITVAASNGATAVATSKGDIYVLHEYQCRKIASRQFNITSISIVGGKLNEKIDNSFSSDENHELNVIGLNNVGNIYIWQESNPQFARCIFSVNRSLKIRQVTLNLNEILFVTYSGEAFQGIVKPRKRKTTENNVHIQKSAFHEFLEKDNCQLLKVTKIPRVHRAVSIHSDLKGRNYAVLQASPKALLTKVPEISCSTLRDHMCLLFHETTESDAIHDVIFKFSNCLFSVHHYIIAVSSSKLSDLITATTDKVIELSNVNSNIFEQLLLFMYTGTCDLLKTGKCPEKLQLLHRNNSQQADVENKNVICEKLNISAFQYYKEQNIKSKSKTASLSESAKDPVRLLQETAKRFGVKTLQKLLDNVYYDDDGFILMKKEKHTNLKPKFERTAFPELQDVILKSKEKKEIPAHKCILAARLEYFNNLFSVRWSENSRTREVSLPFPHNVLHQLIEYLYTDELPFLDNEDIDHVCHLLIVADQLFVLRLKEICECTLCSFLTLKNVVQMLSFSSLYNAEQLKTYCMEFICLNLAAVLELRSLEFIDGDILHSLTDFYSKYNPAMQQRIITPYSYAPSDEVVSVANSVHQISFEDSDCENNKSTLKSQKKRSRPRKSSSTDCSNKKGQDTSNTIEVLNEFSSSNNEIMHSASTVETPERKQQMVEITHSNKVESRVRAIIIAQDKLSCDTVLTEYTKLPTRSSLKMEASLNEFPELNSHNSVGHYSKSPHKSDKIDIKQKITKLSQKQRKRLSSESSLNATELVSPIVSESPRNPWKICTDFNIKSPVGSPDISIATMDSIITDEKKQKENFVKMKTKLLMHTQMEDKAIEDLYKFYNVENVFDEVVTINRVQIGSVASPVWVHMNKMKQS